MHTKLLARRLEALAQSIELTIEDAREGLSVAAAALEEISGSYLTIERGGGGGLDDQTNPEPPSPISALADRILVLHYPRELEDIPPQMIKITPRVLEDTPSQD